jgi:GT2 family glycosyltransferase
MVPRKAVVIVVTHNSRRHLARLKSSLELQTEQDFDLIVWDNASSTTEKPTALDIPAGARLELCDDNLGFAGANNRAAALSDAPLVVLLNPDAFPNPDWLAALIQAAHIYPDAGAIGSTQYAAETLDRYDGLGDGYHVFGLPWRGAYGWSCKSVYPRLGSPFSACAAAAAYPREAWLDAEGFDESFFCFCEDVDLGFRLRLRGWRIIQWPGAVVHHVGGASTGRRSAFSTFYGTRNRIWTFVKNMPGWTLWLFLPAHVALNIVLLCVAFVRGTSGPMLRGMGAAFAGLPQQWRARMHVQSRRRASVFAVLSAMTWLPWTVARRAPVLRAATSLKQSPPK